MEALADIEALVLRCRTDRARDFLREAALCYRSGAYRSAIVDTWIAVVFDLVEKIRELAAAGDAAAREINNTYESYIAQVDAGNDQGVKNALEFERAILETCKQRLEFFGHQEMRDLNRLREDRNQCAHPSFLKPGEPFKPTAELARLHLRAAVDHVLSQPPVQGRAAIESLVGVVSSHYFPKSLGEAIATFQDGPLGRPSDALVRNFCDRLVFGFETAGDPLYQLDQVAMALRALREMHRPISEQRIAAQLSKLATQVHDDRLPAISALIAKSGNAPLIAGPAQIRLIEFVRNGPIAEVGRSIAGLSTNASMLAAAQSRVAEMDRTEIELVISGGGQLIAKPRVLVLLSEVGSWNGANIVFARLVDPIFDFLTDDDVRTIVRMPTTTHADLVGASGYSAFLDEVRRRALLPNAELNGLLRENRAEYLVFEPD